MHVELDGEEPQIFIGPCMYNVATLSTSLYIKTVLCTIIIIPKPR